MVGDVAELISIASYGNDFLNGMEERPLERNSHFPVTFFGTDEKAMRLEQWYEYLRKRECKKIRILYRIVDSSKGSVMINESIQWAFRTVFDDHSEYWTFSPYYFSGWRADIRQVKDFQLDAEKDLTLDEAKKNLEANLDILTKFAHENGNNNWLTAWIKNFMNMKSILYSDTPTLPEYHKAMIVEKNYSLLAKQVLFCAESAWCFTGMGSLSDNCMPTVNLSEQKEKITRELFYSVCDAYVAAMNSF